jgi:hypothetical protein
MNDFLSGYNFARQSDVIFSETIPDNNTHRTYIVDNFELNDNNIIFCKIDHIGKLFNLLKNENDIKNVKVITHEGDYEANEQLFSLKPNCISKWYSVNVNYDHKNLVPIPLGIANDYATIALKYEHLKKEGEAKKLLYINHRNNTCPSSRSWIYDYFQTNDWCTVDQPNLELSDYKKQLDNHKFMLCPRGNGIDTHRLWESLYHGIIPIVENHIHYKCVSDLPVIIVDSFNDVTKNFLEQKEMEILNKKFNFDKLKISWWIDNIRKNNL